ncbi:hypothetical protein DXV76_08300 [Rhodobacteraceae bacterium CCMM004]|nr:hypothetical protein DXV76_08300 [Rhodobacteraceae bacterium CCMM004]
MTGPLRLLTAAAALAAWAAGPAAAQSVYGCADLAGQHHTPAIEGREGTFFRIAPDLHMHHPFSDPTILKLAELSQALALQGTTLVYMPVPTKALAMPGHLPGVAVDFGYDADLAATVYTEGLRKLREAGVVAVDARRAMLEASAADPAFFKADYRWTARGAQLAALAVAHALRDEPSFADLPKGAFSTTPMQPATLDSPTRQRLQQRCQLTLPPVETMTFATSKVQAAQLVRGTSIFSVQARLPLMAVVGTEFTGEEATNFPGFLSEATGLDVVRYAVPGGGAFGAISSYLTSAAFQEQRPAILVWENPIWHSLARFGDQPMAELIAAAGNTCRVPLRLQASPAPDTVRADLSGLDPALDYTIYVDSGAEARAARFTFANADGATRTRVIERSDGQVATGRFYMPTTGLWDAGAVRLDIAFDTSVGVTPRVTACF